jgi:hypothetical protein
MKINVFAGQASGLGVDSIMSYLKTNGTFTHSNGDVREASKHATVAIYRHVGTFRMNISGILGAVVIIAVC